MKEIVKKKKDENANKYNRKFADNFRANVKLFWEQVRLARGVKGRSSINAGRGILKGCSVLKIVCKDWAI